MTVGELIDELSRYDRGQYLGLLLHSRAYPDGAQVVVRGVTSYRPWHGDGPELVGIVAHADNREMPDPPPAGAGEGAP